MKKDEQSNLLELVSKWELGEALKQMLGMAIPEGKLYETVSFSARFERLKEDHRKGVISYDQYNQECNRIVAGMTELIQGLPLTEEDASKVDGQKGEAADSKAFTSYKKNVNEGEIKASGNVIIGDGNKI